MIAVYVVHWNRPEWCERSVESLAASRGAEIAVTVVDNASDRLPRLPDDVMLARLDSNTGYTGGANFGLHEWLSSGADSYCVIAAHDLLVEPTTLASLARVLDERPDLGIVGPRLIGDDTSDGGRILAETSGVELREWISGTCMMIRRESALDVGGFDEAFGSYCEDVDYCIRAHASGWEVGITVGALASGIGTTGGLGVRAPVNSVVLAWKHHGRPRRPTCSGAALQAGGLASCTVTFGRAPPISRRYPPACDDSTSFGSRCRSRAPIAKGRSAHPLATDLAKSSARCSVRPDRESPSHLGSRTMLFGVCAGPTDKYERIALPSIRGETIVVRRHPSIAEAYNTILDAARGADGLVLLHDDVELIDGDLERKLEAVFADDGVAIAGVIGARDNRTLAWWNFRMIGGVVHEITPSGARTLEGNPGRGFHRVDTVDGLLMAFSPWAIHHLRFDTRYPGFDGYDGDICSQAHAAGKTITTIDTEVAHHISGRRYGGTFRQADLLWRSRWATLPAYKRAGLRVRAGLLPIEWRLRHRQW